MGHIKASEIMRPGCIRVYLSGKISGKTELQYKCDFFRAKHAIKRKLPEYKIEFIDPTELPAIHQDWEDYIIRDLMLLKECNVIAMLPDWEESHGARVEYEFAKGLNIKIIKLTDEEVSFFNRIGSHKFL